MPDSVHERMAAMLDRIGALNAAMQLRRIAPISTISIVTFHVEYARSDR